MNTPTLIEHIYSQPTWHFWRDGQEYFIFLEIEEDKTPRMMHLAIPRRKGDIFVPDYLVKEIVLPSLYAEYGTKRFINELFLPKVNEYLASLGGEDNNFPVDGKDFEQFNWIVENALSYVNGEVIMSS